jgi:aminoglycoside phosphotransferase (APT) family kinase protein
MERVEGVTPPAGYHREGLLYDAPATSRRRMVFDVIGNLARLHALDATATGFEFLMHRGRGATALERDLDWHRTALRWGCPGEAEKLEPIHHWLLANQPPEGRISVNHGDSMLANYLFRGERVAAVLDWELAFLGNPANDIAFQVLTHAFLGLGCQPLQGMPSESEWLAEYERASGERLADWEFFVAATAFKLFMILLLVYRDSTSDMEAARQAVRDYTWQSLMDRLAAAKAR